MQDKGLTGWETMKSAIDVPQCVAIMCPYLLNHCQSLALGLYLTLRFYDG